MKKILFKILIALLFVSCQDREKSSNSFKLIPEDAAVIIQTPNLKNLQQELKDFSFFERNKLSAKNHLKNKLGFLKHTDTLTEALIAISLSENDKFIYTLIFNEKPNFQLDSIKNKSVESIKSEGNNYKKMVLEDNTFFVSTGDAPYIASNSEEKLVKILNEEKNLTNQGFKNVYAAIEPNKTSIIFNHQISDKFLQRLFPNLDLKNLENYAGWSAVDLDLTKDGILFNGLSISDSPSNFHNIFKNSGTISQEFAAITPQNAVGFTSIGYRDSEIFLRNLKNFRRDSIKSPGDEIILNTQEAGIIYTEEKSFFGLKTLISTDASDLISNYAELEENYRDYPIYKVSKPETFETLFSPVFNPKNLEFAVAVDEFIIFGASAKKLRDLIADYVNQNTLIHQSNYKDNEQNLAAESSILLVGIPEKLKSTLASGVEDGFSTEMQNLAFGNHKMAAFQLVEEGDFAHIHGAFQSQTSQTQNTRTEEILSVSLDAELLNEPILVKNHLNNQMDIAVQDINNTLYLISNKGTVFWKKKLSGPILGEIQQADLFKNGRFQLAFTTPYSIEVLDRNGNTVKSFPLKFKDEITQPLSLFDYDNNRKYRFLITQNDEVFMYDKNGESVRGFDFRETNSEILKAPKHLRIQNKDYIVFPEKSGKLNILSRQGEHRVSVKESIDFSENEWYEFENNFASTNAEGNLVKVSQTSRVTTENTNFSENHRISARPNLLVSLSENILKIRDKELSLDYGLYTPPKIHYVNDKYYISLTDLQTQKIYVFDSNAELLPGFPVYGTSGIDLNNADIDSRPEFVVKGGEKEVLMYKL